MKSYDRIKKWLLEAEAVFRDIIGFDSLCGTEIAAVLGTIELLTDLKAALGVNAEDTGKHSKAKGKSPRSTRGTKRKRSTRSKAHNAPKASALRSYTELKSLQ